MKYNPFIRLLCSIPIILVFLYFIPFVGVCLILLRYFLYSEKEKNFSTNYFNVSRSFDTYTRMFIGIS